jgi:uncharacterized protein involved in exopolysaccharide biosynthesis
MERGPQPERRSERRRGLVIVLFLVLTVALALVLAFFYSMPSAGY